MNPLQGYVSIQYHLLMGENVWLGGYSWDPDGRVEQTLGYAVHTATLSVKEGWDATG